MQNSQNSLFRRFAGSFAFGALAVALASTTGRFKDLNVEVGSRRFSGSSAWMIGAFVCGLFSGILGLGISSLQGMTRSSQPKLGAE